MVAARAVVLSITTAAAVPGGSRAPSSQPQSQPSSPLSRRQLSSLAHSPSTSSSRRLLQLGAQQQQQQRLLVDQVALLLQEWLTIHKFPATLRCFAEEYATKSNNKNAAVPEMNKWVEMSQQLDSFFAANDCNTVHSSSITKSTDVNNRGLLERIVVQALAVGIQSLADHNTSNSSKSKPPPLTPVVVAKRPLTAGATLQFTSKRSLPASCQPGSKSAASLHLSPPVPLVRRPHSAAVSGSTSSSPKPLTRLGRLDEDISDNTTAHRKSHLAATTNQTSPTTTAPSRTLETKSSKRLLPPHRKSQPSSDKPSSPAQSPMASRRSSRQLLGAIQTSSSSRLLQEWSNSNTTTTGPAEDTKQQQQQGETDADDPATIAGDNGKECEPAMELEEMSEERLTAQFGAFSKGTIKKLRRVLAKSSAHSQEMQRTKKAMDKIQVRAQQQHQRSTMAVQQTELLSSTMDMLIKEPCSLCRHVFLKKNLTTKVSCKSVCDLRASWAATKRKSLGVANSGEAYTNVTDSPATGDDGDHGGSFATATVQQEQSLESVQQISHLYDEVPVCVFCAQLVLDFPSYRPSSAEQKDRKEEKRRLAVERSKQRDAQRQLDKLKCDPLDFHAYELNSDDDEAHGSDTEEVIEVDANGRFHVVRRRRPRRRTERTPQQLGLVSKRLHYDHLRSGSVHALNRQEWGVLNAPEE